MSSACSSRRRLLASSVAVLALALLPFAGGAQAARTGETIRTEMWPSGDRVSFRCSVLERGVLVLSNGLAVLRS